jgi:hypothetical protein
MVALTVPESSRRHPKTKPEIKLRPRRNPSNAFEQCGRVLRSSLSKFVDSLAHALKRCINPLIGYMQVDDPSGRQAMRRGRRLG